MMSTLATNFSLSDEISGDYRFKSKIKQLCLFESQEPFRKENPALEKLYKEGHFIGVKPSSFRPQALFLDMDGTSIKEESLDHLVEMLKLEEEDHSQITEDAMQGRISFKKAYFKRMKLLKGLSEESFSEVTPHLSFQAGIKELCEWFRKKELPIFLVSGGLSYFCQSVASSLGALEWHGNYPEISQGKLTGETIGTLVDTLEKKTWLLKMCKKYKINPEQSIMIGDGANDKEIMSACGLSVGFHPRKVLYPYLNVYNATKDHSVLIDFLQET